jgi:hypothetical protein
MLGLDEDSGNCWLEAEGLVILNPNKSRGQSLYIIA